MTLTLADIELWDDAAIDQVFAAANLRAAGAQTTGDTVGDLLSFVRWQGAAAAAARDSANRIKLTLGDHADQCKAVAAAAKKAAAEVADLKYRLSMIKADAEEAFISIDENTGKLTPKTAVLTVSQLDHQKAMMANLAGRITQLLAGAETVDRDLATAIEMADGAASGPAPGGPPPNLPKPPPDSASPADVKKWWDSLTPQQQVDYIAHDPAAIDRDGIPIDIRDAGNRIRLPHEIAAAKADLDRARAAVNARSQDSDDGALYAAKQQRDGAQSRYDDLLGIQNALYPKNPDGTPKVIDKGDRRSLILLGTRYDGQRPHVFAAIGIGDVDDATHVGVTVGGVGTHATSLPGMADEATNLKHTSSDILRASHDANPDSVAAIAWVGYEPPTDMADPRVTSDDLARTAAPHLNRFFNGLVATSENPHQEITAFGHSYGSLVTSLALQEGSPVKNVVFYGSPGLELGNVGDLHMAPGGHAYYEQTPDDPIKWVQRVPAGLAAVPVIGPELVWLFGSGDHHQPFGDTPNEMPDITQLSTSAGVDPVLGQDRAGSRGHSEYPRDDGTGDHDKLRMSAYNLAAVLSDVPGATKTGN